MIAWKNLDTLASYKKLSALKRVNLPDAMSGEKGAERVKKYSVPMACGLSYNFAAKAVDDEVLAALSELAAEQQLTEKFAALYNGEMINTGEKRLVLHQLTRGQLGGAVMAEQPWNMLFITETALVSNLSAPSNAVMFQQSENQYAQLLGAIICPSAMRADLTLERWLYHGAEFQFVPVFSTPVYTWPVYVLPMMSVTV
jgi:hypothetical protein